MKTTTIENKSSPANSVKPFFNKSGEGSFFASKKEENAPFFQAQYIQKNLAMGAPNDPFEQEADKIGRQVMDNFGEASSIQAKLSSLGIQSSLIQPMPISTRISRMVQHRQNIIQSKCDGFDEEESMSKSTVSGIQYAGPGGTVSSAIEQRINSHRGGGQAMDAETKMAMESSFGADFGGVKIHTGTEAAQMSQALNAHAFTVGSDIFFNNGMYQPRNREGTGLLAHELTHTVQQGEAVQNKGINRRSLSSMLSRHSMAHLSSMDAKSLSPKEMAKLQSIPEEELMQTKEKLESKEVDKVQKKNSGLSLRRCDDEGGSAPAATASIAEINSPNTPAPVKRIIPRVNTGVNVTVSGATTASPVVLSIEGGSAANGTAKINGAATHSLTSTSVVNLKGDTQTSPGNANNLKLVAKQGTTTLATSNQFSVAAYPTEIGFNFNRLMEGEAFPGVAGLYWGAAYDVVFTSDSGTNADCDKTKISENVIVTTGKGLWAGASPTTSNFLKTTNSQTDHHATGGVATAAAMKTRIDAADVNSLYVANQFFRFSCERTDIAEDKAAGPKVPTSGFKITRSLSKYFIHVKKEGFANNGVAAGAVDDSTVKNAKVS